MSELETPVVTQEPEVSQNSPRPIIFPWASVVIPTYGKKGVGLTRNCVTSLIKTHDHIKPEIIIVSDGDNEEVMQELVEITKINEIIGLVRIERKGFAAACNAGLRHANGQLAVFLVNNDIEFEVNTLQILVDAMLNSGAGVVGCRLLYPDRTIQHAGVAYIPAPAGSPVPGYFDHLCRFKPENYIDAVVMHQGLVTGALLGIRRDFIERSGYLDERFSFTAEDMDICIRAIECGLPPLYVGYTYAIHHEGASRGRTPEEKMALEPEIAKKELESLQFFFTKYVGIDMTRFMPNMGGTQGEE